MRTPNATGTLGHLRFAFPGPSRDRLGPHRLIRAHGATCGIEGKGCDGPRAGRLAGWRKIRQARRPRRSGGKSGAILGSSPICGEWRAGRVHAGHGRAGRGRAGRGPPGGGPPGAAAGPRPPTGGPSLTAFRLTRGVLLKMIYDREFRGLSTIVGVGASECDGMRRVLRCESPVRSASKLAR